MTLHAAQPNEVIIDGITYRANAGGFASVYTCAATQSEANIQSEIVFNGNSYRITKIDDGAFYGRVSLTSVVIPSSVTEVGGIAFYGCQSLESIVMSNAIKEIGYSAFQNCKSLESIVVPEGITIIPKNCFNGCEKLSSISLPSSLTQIE